MAKKKKRKEKKERQAGKRKETITFPCHFSTSLGTQKRAMELL